jgi:predicted RNase H-like nuclease (RuvC/YqgF family)
LKLGRTDGFARVLYIMSALDTAKELGPMVTTAENVIDLFKEKLTILEKQIAALEMENATLKSQNTDLSKKNTDLRQQLDDFRPKGYFADDTIRVLKLPLRERPNKALADRATDREKNIEQFAKEYGFRMRFYKKGLCVIFDRWPKSN